MADNAQKTPVVRSLNLVAQKQVLDAIQLTGKALPCSIVSVTGWIVTVKFEVQTDDFTLPQVTMPVASSNYDYLPLQVGDFGITVSADTYIGNASGLGGGNSFIDLVSNLSALLFVPIGNVAWAAPTDPAVRVVRGPDGVIIQTLDGTTTIVEVLKDKIRLTRGGSVFLIENSGMTATGDLEVDGDLHVTGNLTVDGSTALGGGAQQAVLLADGSSATKVTAS